METTTQSIVEQDIITIKGMTEEVWKVDKRPMTKDIAKEYRDAFIELWKISKTTDKSNIDQIEKLYIKCNDMKMAMNIYRSTGTGGVQEIPFAYYFKVYHSISDKLTEHLESLI